MNTQTQFSYNGTIEEIILKQKTYGDYRATFQLHSQGNLKNSIEIDVYGNGIILEHASILNGKYICTKICNQSESKEYRLNQFINDRENKIFNKENCYMHVKEKKSNFLHNNIFYIGYPIRGIYIKNLI